MKISGEELKICREVHAGLVSNERQNINYLFLEPVDPSYFPTYLKIVKRPMDLGTLGENLEKGMYGTKNEFYADAQLIFENAIAFNKDRAESSFVVGLAKKMAKAFERERKKAERRAMAAAGGLEVDAALEELNEVSEKKKKKKLKLKLKRNSSAGELSGLDQVHNAPPVDSKASVDITQDGQSKASFSESKLEKKEKSKILKEKDIPEKAKPTQPKFKLKLSLSKKSEQKETKDEKKKKKAKEIKRDIETQADVVKPVPEMPKEREKQKSPEQKKSEAAPSKKLKLKLNRGKELPKGVIADTHSPTPPPALPSKSKKQRSQSPTPDSSSVRSGETLSNRDGESLKEQSPDVHSLLSSKSRDPTAKEKSSKTSPAKEKSKDFAKKEKSISVSSSKSLGREISEKMTVCKSSSQRFHTNLAAAATEHFAGATMNAVRRAQCYKIMASLKRRQTSNCRWFLKPVSDPKLIKDYREKIQTPMDLGTIMSKLDKDQYSSLALFVLDLRRVFANCLQYNTSIDDSFRPVAVECLAVAEDLFKFFIAKNEAPEIVYPSLLYCWEDCVKAIDSLLDLTNPDDGHQTAHYFLHPVSFFCGGSFPEGYLDKVKKPIDLGTIMQKLITGCYSSVGAFVADCRTVIENCRTFYSDRNDGESFLEKANRLNDSMEQHLGQLVMFDRSDEGAKAREKAESKVMMIKKPEKSFLKEIMRDLRASTYTDRSAKITESATMHFEKPVDTTYFPDYLKYVDSPMDLETVDRKIESGSYMTPEDFEYDITLIFRNCERYNTPKNNIHMIALGKHTAKTFRKLFFAKLRLLERSGSFAKPSILPTSAKRDVGGKKRPLSPTPDERQSKKVAVESSKVTIKPPSRTASKSVTSTCGGKSGPKSKSPKNSSGKKVASSTSSKPTPVVDSDVPVPMHVAIASIKESYPGRRQNKDLEGWEEDCLRFFRQLMRHPWISAERPKYIFHVPVPIIFPEIRDSYAAKIKTPMDLTTAEAKLLQGAYLSAEEFVSDIALVFSNAITFNQAGHDIGEPMSCAYFEASTHLLKYSRWLSLEILQSHLSEISGSPVVEKGCALTWSLTTQNREMARKEMEKIVFNELLDKTEPGEKLSWSEQECEKLLKALRHMTDSKHMSFFVQMNFPPDYTAFISKPIAWEKCQEKLRERKYNKIGEVVADLRLIFSNALKYNDRARLVSSVSKLAYDSAIHMSKKLEAAVDRMLLTVSDRIGREKIDTITSHREIEAQERAEEEQLKRQWEKENPSAVQVKTKLRVVNQRNSSRKHVVTDFEFPFYDEEDDHEESHVDSVRHAKSIFEKQQKARVAMKAMSLSIGHSVFERLEQRAAAKAWACRMAYRLHMERKRNEEEQHSKLQMRQQEKESVPETSSVSAALCDDKRALIKISLQKPKKHKPMLSIKSLE